MYMVTVLRTPEPPELAAASLAARQGISAYEARTRLAGGTPRVVAVLADRAVAMAQVQGLCADGFAASLLDGDDVEHDGGRDLAASLRFDETSFTATMRSSFVRFAS